MSDIRDPVRFMEGRWDWTRGGYEAGFPRNCQFTDVDASIEFDGHRLVIECKQWDGTGIGIPKRPLTGQSRFLRDEVALGKTVFVVYGLGRPHNDPFAMRIYGDTFDDDKTVDWRSYGQEERRVRFKRYIDWAMGLLPSDPDTLTA